MTLLCYWGRLTETIGRKICYSPETSKWELSESAGKIQKYDIINI
jgi:hypothetical protein